MCEYVCKCVQLYETFQVCSQVCLVMMMVLHVDRHTLMNEKLIVWVYARGANDDDCYRVVRA